MAILFFVVAAHSQLDEIHIEWGMSYKELKKAIPYKTYKLKIPGSPWLVYEYTLEEMKSAVFCKFYDDQLYEIEFNIIEKILSEDDYPEIYYKLQDKLIMGLDSAEYQIFEEWTDSKYICEKKDYGRAVTSGHLSLMTAIPGQELVLKLKKEGDYNKVSLILTAFYESHLPD